MIAFKQHLEESLNSAYPWSRTQDINNIYFRNVRYQFKDLNQNTFVVGIDLDKFGWAEVWFKTNDSFEKIIESKNSLKIFGTIAQIIRRFVNSNRSSIARIAFASWSNKQDTLYNKFIRRIAKELGGEVESDNDGIYQIKLEPS